MKSPVPGRLLLVSLLSATLPGSRANPAGPAPDAALLARAPPSGPDLHARGGPGDDGQAEVATWEVRMWNTDLKCLGNPVSKLNGSTADTKNNGCHNFDPKNQRVGITANNGGGVTLYLDKDCAKGLPSSIFIGPLSNSNCHNLTTGDNKRIQSYQYLPPSP